MATACFVLGHGHLEGTVVCLIDGETEDVRFEAWSITAAAHRMLRFEMEG